MQVACFFRERILVADYSYKYLFGNDLWIEMADLSLCRLCVFVHNPQIR